MWVKSIHDIYCCRCSVSLLLEPRCSWQPMQWRCWGILIVPDGKWATATFFRSRTYLKWGRRGGSLQCSFSKLHPQGDYTDPGPDFQDELIIGRYQRRNVTGSALTQTVSYGLRTFTSSSVFSSVHERNSRIIYRLQTPAKYFNKYWN